MTTSSFNFVSEPRPITERMTKAVRATGRFLMAVACRALTLYEHHKATRMLMALDDHALKDIGLHRSEILSAVYTHSRADGRPLVCGGRHSPTPRTRTGGYPVMTTNHHVAPRHVAVGSALLAAGLALGLGLFGGPVSLPGSPALAVSPSLESAAPMPLRTNMPLVEERETDNSPVTATGMEVIPVFD